MKWNGKLILLLVYLTSCSSENEMKHNPSIYSIIPQTQELIKKPNCFIIDNQTTIYSDSTLKETSLNFITLIKNSFNITLKYSTYRKKKNCIVIHKSNDKKEDNYQLNISKELITIKAAGKTGFFYASQTILQLIELNNTRKNDKLKLPGLYINDWSKFSHRGLLLDCCRHFFSVSTIKKYLRLMSFYKMNILHWHLTEDQAWRLAIDKYPNLIKKGAFRKQNNGVYGGYYSKKEIKDIVTYAKNLNINIIPEIELPGHSQAAIASYPYLSCTGEKYEVANDWGVFKEIYCAGNDSVFTFLENVLDEVIELFPYKYIHIGGDEAPKYRWENCSKCQTRIKENKLKNEHELQSYFIKRINKYLTSKGRSIIGWDEILEGGLAENAIVQSWRGLKGGIAAIESNHQAIMSPTSHAYFDYHIKTTDLPKVFSFNPIPPNIDKEKKHLIIGGECNVWTEHINNEKELDNKVFPRLLAMAEVLWTSNNNRDYIEFEKRVQDHYPMLKNRNVNYGIEVSPCKIEVKKINNKLQINLTKGSKDLDLKYKWENITDYKLMAKNTTIENKSANLIVQAYKGVETYGNAIYQPFKFHKANTCTIDYNLAYSPSYPANNENTLSDGKLGTLDFRDGNWQGFWDSNLECTIDLKEIKEIEKISTHFYQYNNSWIFFPEKVIYQTSTDSINWVKWGEITNKKKPELRGKNIQLYEGLNTIIKTRYIKVNAKRLKKVPSWHEAAGASTWLFIDEIIVE
jgi:hexosaminidase